MTAETGAMWSAGSTALPRPLIFPIGHQIGPRYTPGGTEIAMRVRRGVSFHELTDRQAAVWRLAHGVAEAINDECRGNGARLRNASRVPQRPSTSCWR